MAARAYWKGSLKLSLVSCPVLLYPASTSSDKTSFHMINKETGNRLKQQMVDAETGDVVESDQKGRGYELKKGEYVEIEKQELEAVQIESSHTIDIDIDSFVPKTRSTNATSTTPSTHRAAKKAHRSAARARKAS
jgi:DNA end-binding protein Ku